MIDDVVIAKFARFNYQFSVGENIFVRIVDSNHDIFFIFWIINSKTSRNRQTGLGLDIFLENMDRSVWWQI